MRCYCNLIFSLVISLRFVQLVVWYRRGTSNLTFSTHLHISLSSYPFPFEPEIVFPIYKGILSGSVFEAYRMDKLPEDLKDDLLDSRAKSLRRARTRLRRVINSNAGQWWDPQKERFYMPLFVTLTFKDNVTSIPAANYLFNRFIQRVNRKLLNSKKAVLKYSRVIEFQKRGAVHYHMLFYNVPFIVDLHKKLESLWGHGFVFNNSVKLDSVKNTGAYVVKYMSKAHDDPRLEGKKLYASSQGLIQPILIRDDGKLIDMIEAMPRDGLIMDRELEWGMYKRWTLRGSSLRFINSGKPKGVLLTDSDEQEALTAVENYLVQHSLFE